MQLQEVTLENFKSFSGTHKFEFDARSVGLFFITGRNEVDKALGANGAGKSTLFDAIFWCLYGKTLRNLRAGDTRFWGSNDGYSVSIQAEILGEHYVITRVWNPNSLQINNKNVEQADVEKLIGLTPEAFKHSVIMGQTNPMFFDLKPMDKLALVSDVLDLSKWNKLSTKCKEEKKWVERQIELLEKDHNFYKGKLEETYAQLERELARSEKFEEDKKDDLFKVDQRIHSVKAQLVREEEALEEAEEYYKETISLKEAIKKELEELYSDYDEVIDAIREIGGTLTSTRVYKKECEERIDRFKTLGKENKCFVCEQEVTVGHIYEHLTALEKERDEYQEQYHKADVIRMELEDKRGQLGKKVKAMEADHKSLDGELDKRRNKAHSLRGSVNNICSNLDALEDSRKELEQRENYYLESVERAMAHIDELESKQVELEEKTKKRQKELAAANYWVKGFKELRLYVIDKAVSSLEVEVNSSLHQLGLHDWSIHFEMEKENKSGGVTKGFHVKIMSPSNDEPVPWEAWSGGESQRLKIAGTMGLANLILNQAGVQTNIEVWDEPSQYLSTEGIDDLLETLHQRSLATNKQVWLIDHRSLNYGKFAASYTIVKDENGSRVE